MPGLIRTATLIIANGTALFCGYSLYSGNEKFYREIAMPCLRLLDAERAHKFAVWSASKGLVPAINACADPPIMQTSLWGLKFQNPVGLAAGFDKHAEAIGGLLKMGFGFVEVGSITPEPQPGNPKPRVFRLTEEKAVINRYGFNSEGHIAALRRLKSWRYKRMEDATCSQGIVGINLGKNKTSPDPVGDYTKGVTNLGCFGDYIVINVSSPNTPGLRDMQGRKQLADLIDKVLQARDLLPVDPKPPLLVKISPDLTEKDKSDIADVVCRPKAKVDGLIISNTTVSRPSSLKSPEKKETGGLSGQPLKELSTQTIKDMYQLTKGNIPIIGVGGIQSGRDAYEKIRAGASLVQLYSALSYEGPPLVARIKRELINELKSGGFETVEAAVGADHR
ncbi:dihydroorotate dehydrogenase (quinone), mitochondrial-like isoform X2 [Apostichopus japonicus]|uniref:dihydroorotate dehydrogenase (quinone), mitochondrial-like isoform X2 n=1 Tax=Stichopus japonicus TaxID=307972 RepID=UPI003AB81A33